MNMGIEYDNNRFGHVTKYVFIAWHLRAILSVIFNPHEPFGNMWQLVNSSWILHISSQRPEQNQINFEDHLSYTLTLMLTNYHFYTMPSVVVYHQPLLFHIPTILPEKKTDFLLLLLPLKNSLIINLLRIRKKNNNQLIISRHFIHCICVLLWWGINLFENVARWWLRCSIYCRLD